jgi:hypothetical protein
LRRYPKRKSRKKRLLVRARRPVSAQETSLSDEIIVSVNARLSKQRLIPRQQRQSSLRKHLHQPKKMVRTAAKVSQRSGADAAVVAVVGAVLAKAPQRVQLRMDRRELKS